MFANIFIKTLLELLEEGFSVIQENSALLKTFILSFLVSLDRLHLSAEVNFQNATLLSHLERVSQSVQLRRTGNTLLQPWLTQQGLNKTKKARATFDQFDMRAVTTFSVLVSLLGLVAAQGTTVGTTIDGTTVSAGETTNIGTTVTQSGGDVTATDQPAATTTGSSQSSASSNGGNHIYAGNVVDNVWLAVGAGMGVVAGGLGVFL